MDAFARVESAVVAYLIQLNEKCCPTAPLGQKMETLRKARDRFQKPAKLDARLDKIAMLSTVRADVVHSVMEIVQVREGEGLRWLFMFRNSGDAERPVLLLSPETMRKVTGDLNTIAHQFSDQPLKPPAPAAPAAASG